MKLNRGLSRSNLMIGAIVRKALLVAAITSALCVASSAQERTPNQGKGVFLRTWPVRGNWQVSLVRLINNSLGCLMVTGHINRVNGEHYVWGIRWREGSVATIIVDNNHQAVSGSSIKLVIDRVPVGSFKITRRVDTGNGFEKVVAELPTDDRDRILDLIRVGSLLQFVTDNSTYSASLKGAQQALLSFKTCTVEANQLNATR
jgi:hypothetical protein